MSSFAEDVTDGDVTTGEDPVVRQAAIDALGNMNGTVVAIEPTSGRILAMVNQRLALSERRAALLHHQAFGCAGWLERGHDLQRDRGPLGGRYHMNLTTALAHSNNAYFEALGRKLGFEKVSLLRASIRTRRTGRLRHSRRTAGLPIPTKSFLPSSAAWARCAPSAKAFP